MPSLFPLALVSAFVLLAPSVPRQPLAAQTCTGCVGTGESRSESGGSCDGLVQITVTVAPGHCKWLLGEEPGDIQCRPNRDCEPTITRTWTGLEPGSVMDFCIVLNGERLCLYPNPTAGNGSGSDERPSAKIECSDDPANTRSYSVESASCGLFATAQGKCSACNDYF